MQAREHTYVAVILTGLSVLWTASTFAGEGGIRFQFAVVGPPVFSASPGTPITEEYLVMLRTLDARGEDGAQGWSVAVAADGRLLSPGQLREHGTWSE